MPVRRSGNRAKSFAGKRHKGHKSQERTACATAPTILNFLSASNEMPRSREPIPRPREWEMGAGIQGLASGRWELKDGVVASTICGETCGAKFILAAGKIRSDLTGNSSNFQTAPARPAQSSSTGTGNRFVHLIRVKHRRVKRKVVTFAGHSRRRNFRNNFSVPIHRKRPAAQSFQSLGRFPGDGIKFFLSGT